MKIRKATGKDVDGIYELFLEMIKSEDAASRKSGISLMTLRKKDKNFEKNARKELLREIRAKNSLYLVAEDKGKLTAYAYGFVPKNDDPFFSKSIVGYFSAILVTKKYRRKGLAKKLKVEMENWFKKKKCDFIYLEVFAENPASKLYKKWGYKVTTQKMFKKVKK